LEEFKKDLREKEGQGILFWMLEWAPLSAKAFKHIENLIDPKPKWVRRMRKKPREGLEWDAYHSKQ
jgi:hypothetical protein